MRIWLGESFTNTLDDRCAETLFIIFIWIKEACHYLCLYQGLLQIHRRFSCISLCDFYIKCGAFSIDSSVKVAFNFKLLGFWTLHISSDFVQHSLSICLTDIREWVNQILAWYRIILDSLRFTCVWVGLVLIPCNLPIFHVVKVNLAIFTQYVIHDLNRRQEIYSTHQVGLAITSW